MTIEKQVVSLELAKRLKELGVGMRGYFSWWYGRGGAHIWDATEVGELASANNRFIAWAYTVGELAEMTKADLRHARSFEADPVGGGMRTVGEWSAELGADTGFGMAPADAYADLLIHLVEKGTLDPKKL